MSNIVQISIANDYSPFPAGRDDNDGPFNGSKFRELLLKPKYFEAKQHHTKLMIELDGLQSFGSSFLEESFGGLARSYPEFKDDILRRIEFNYTRPSFQRYANAIKKYIKEAKPRNSG